VEVGTEGPRTVVSLSTSNQTSRSNAEELEARLREMSAVSDSAEYYQMVLRRSTRLRDQSGLGLARILAESESKLSMEREADGRVTVMAKTYVELEEGS
jgi:hypothetical protein